MKNGFGTNLYLGPSQRPAANKCGIARNALVRGLFVAFLLTASVSAKAATITAASVSRNDVNTALQSASAGDTVVIPAGTATWTSGISWTAPADVTLMGAGDLSTQGGGDATVIVDGYNSSSPLFSIVANVTGVLRIAGLTVRGHATYSPLKENGIVVISGGTLRMDHCHFDVTQGNMKAVWFYVDGVLDHCIINPLNVGFYISGAETGASAGNVVWSEPTGFGTSNFFYMEDNLFIGSLGGPFAVGDGWTGSRVVLRFNTIQGGAGFEGHATGHSGDDRGVRATESYGNLFTVLPGQANAPFDMANVPSGPSLIWGNTSEDDNLKNGIVFNVTRKNNDTYSQSPTPTGWGYAGTAFNGTGSNWDGGTVNGTDTVLGYPCLDQPGRGQGDLLMGIFPTKINSTTGTIHWPNQAIEPVYLWNIHVVPNPGYGGALYDNATLGRVVANRDYYPQASGIQTNATTPFDGTSGTGWGTLARRPTTCTTGVAYFATDQGSWNTSASNPYGVQQNGASGVLYQCSATNTWTLYYTPYTYPHPLQLPSPPHGLHILP